MTLEDSIQAFRLRVLAEAARSGNVQATCERFGLSRTPFYRLRRRLERYGPDGLHPKRQRAGRGRPAQVTVAEERRIVAIALAWPTRGPQWVHDQLRRDGLDLAPTTIWRVLHRHGLGTRRERLAVLERESARTGLLTERTVRPRRAGRHMAAEQPGDLCALDAFYVGKLKGVGKVWPLTACDAASSYGWARVIAGEVTAGAMARVLGEVVRPAYRAAGWPLRRVLTDNGKEFAGRFAEACAAWGIRQTRTKPRHAWTNGFVERLQGTILHEHWRIAFRRHDFTSVRALQQSLDGFLRFYNTQRPHRGYRLRGQTPVTLFRGAVAA
jgi:transposase InsO family protein